MTERHEAHQSAAGLYRCGAGSQVRELFRRMTANLPKDPYLRRNAVGRPVVIGIGTLILILIAVAFFF